MKQHTIERLRSIENQLHPFEMKIGGVETFLPDNPVIYLHIEPTPELLATRQAMLHVIGQDKQRHFTPHLTLTMRLDARQDGEPCCHNFVKPSGTRSGGASPSIICG